MDGSWLDEDETLAHEQDHVLLGVEDALPAQAVRAQVVGTRKFCPSFYTIEATM